MIRELRDFVFRDHFYQIIAYFFIVAWLGDLSNPVYPVGVLACALGEDLKKLQKTLRTGFTAKIVKNKTTEGEPT